MHYDAFQFVQAIREKYWLGMLAAIDSALIGAARWPTTRKRQGPVHPGTDAEFMRFLIAAREYLLSEGRVRPQGLADDQFILLKPLCDHLVAHGRFPLERLEMFRDIDPWHIAPGAAPVAPAAPTDTDPDGQKRA